ncbi:MAG: 2,3-bisphosphoglycerate-independent phosphoglycerate mutase [Phycisphaerales bacterium]
MPKLRNTPLILIIRDGWGTNPYPEHRSFNAVELADTPVADALMRDWPSTLIKTSGPDVGLTEGTMGNSEVGHQNIGAGRIVDQDAVRISKAARAGFGTNPVLRDAVASAARSNKAVHLLGICSDAGVHGLLDHLYALLELCREQAAPRVYVHLFTDGRDTGPFSGRDFVEAVENRCLQLDGDAFHVASIIGRYWAMDRDNRWERVRRAYDCLTGRGDPVPNFATAQEAVQAYYDYPEGGATLAGDEFISPRTVGDAESSRIRSGDTVIFYNYRGDRPRELCSAFLLPEFHGSEEVKPSPDTGERGFDRGPKLDLNFVIMTPYSNQLAALAKVAFEKPPRMIDIAGEYFSRLGLTQFRCAETEKYPHVTFFFNDYRDEPFAGEHREIIQSPKVATYDLQPEMSARGVCDAVLRRLSAQDCEDVIVVNFANGDMVGHTGNLDAAIQACQTVDACVGQIVDRTLARGGSVIVTADHGNAEQMWDPQANSPHTAHTTYDVPLIVVGEAFRGCRLVGDTDPAGWFDERLRSKRGRLADILPTALEMMGLDKPEAMTGRSLLMEPQ